MEVRLRNLDVIAEDAIEANLERADAGALPLALFHLGDHLPSRSAVRAELIKAGIDAVARKPAIAGERRRFVDQRAVDVVPQIGQLVERSGERTHQRRLQCIEQQLQPGNSGKRLSKSNKITRS